MLDTPGGISNTSFHLIYEKAYWCKIQWLCIGNYYTWDNTMYDYFMWINRSISNSIKYVSKTKICSHILKHIISRIFFFEIHINHIHFSSPTIQELNVSRPPPPPFEIMDLPMPWVVIKKNFECTYAWSTCTWTGAVPSLVY